MPRQQTCECPSGLKVVIRSRIARDFDILTSDDPFAMDRYLEAFILQTVDRGPYPDSQFYSDGKPKIADDFLMADWWFLLMSHHQLDAPKEPFTKTFCCDNDGCDHRQIAKMVLGDEDSTGRIDRDGLYRLPVSHIRDDVAQNLKENSFKDTFDGKTIWVRLATKRSAENATDRIKKNPSKKWSTTLASRIVRVQDVGENFEAIREWVGSLDSDQEDELLTLLDSWDCGIDWLLFPFCPKCRETIPWDIEVDPNFFTRTQKRKRRRSRK